jgi:15-cis-phytoene synthase
VVARELAGFGRGREQHPADARAAPPGAEGAVQPEYLLELVDAAETELAEAPCRNYAELALYCYRSSGVLHEMLAGLLGLRDPANERAVRRHAQRSAPVCDWWRSSANCERPGRGAPPVAARLDRETGAHEEPGGEARRRCRAGGLPRPARRRGASRWTRPRRAAPAERPRQRPGWCLRACIGAASRGCTTQLHPGASPAISTISGLHGAPRGAPLTAEEHGCNVRK